MSRLPYKWVVATVFVFGTFMDLLDTTSVQVAIPTLAREFDASVSQIEWVVLGFVLSLAVWVPASGWLGDRFGTKRIFLTAVFLFTAASVLCGVATSLPQLTVFRILQGVGGGLMIPVGNTMLFRAFPPIERARASTVLAIPMVLGPALGPLFGGWLTTNHSWRWIFYINLPIGIVTFALGVVGLREHREPAAGRFDVVGFFLSGASLSGVLLALSHGPSDGWGSASVLVPGILGVGGFAALIWLETHIEEPMLALRLLKERMFRTGNMVAFGSLASLAGVTFIMPLFLQDLYGLSAASSGSLTFWSAIGMVIASQAAGRLYHVIGPRRLMFTGLSAMTAVSFSFLAFSTQTSLWVIGGMLFARGLTMGLFIVPMMTASFANISVADTGRATSITSVARHIAASLGVAITGTALVEAVAFFGGGDAGGVDEIEQATLSGYRVAFFVIGLMTLLAAGSALLIRDRDAESTIRRSRRSDPVPDAVPALE